MIYKCTVWIGKQYKKKCKTVYDLFDGGIYNFVKYVVCPIEQKIIKPFSNGCVYVLAPLIMLVNANQLMISLILSFVGTYVYDCFNKKIKHTSELSSLIFACGGLMLRIVASHESVVAFVFLHNWDLYDLLLKAIKNIVP